MGQYIWSMEKEAEFWQNYRTRNVTVTAIRYRKSSPILRFLHISECGSSFYNKLTTGLEKLSVLYRERGDGREVDFYKIS